MEKDEWGSPTNTPSLPSGYIPANWTPSERFCATGYYLCGLGIVSIKKVPWCREIRDSRFHKPAAICNNKSFQQTCCQCTHGKSLLRIIYWRWPRCCCISKKLCFKLCVPLLIYAKNTRNTKSPLSPPPPKCVRSTPWPVGMIIYISMK